MKKWWTKLPPVVAPPSRIDCAVARTHEGLVGGLHADSSINHPIRRAVPAGLARERGYHVNAADLIVPRGRK